MDVVILVKVLMNNRTLIPWIVLIFFLNIKLGIRGVNKLKYTEIIRIVIKIVIGSIYTVACKRNGFVKTSLTKLHNLRRCPTYCTSLQGSTPPPIPPKTAKKGVKNFGFANHTPWCQNSVHANGFCICFAKLLILISIEIGIHDPIFFC